MKNILKKNTPDHTEKHKDNYVSISMQFEDKLLQSKVGDNSFFVLWASTEESRRKEFFYSQIERIKKKNKALASR